MPELCRFGGMVIVMLFHEEELYKAWNQAIQGQHFDKIAPL